MNNNAFEILKKDIQEVIDLLANKQFTEANFKLADASELLDEILDLSADDEDLIEISRYQVLLNQLQQKVNNSI
ncbi:hypothetical protein [Flavobacterium sp. 3HN19-14]|uniref:hypothetical protein n=1 Tax=Flavobacterium sp. 3HN19-14 TaxID=3448133 RepID=UPI003EDF9C55